jgi:hypothetical protein
LINSIPHASSSDLTLHHTDKSIFTFIFYRSRKFWPLPFETAIS